MSGGCQGNSNRFVTKEFCEAKCKRGGPAREVLPAGDRPKGALVDICNLPRDPGEIEAYSNAALCLFAFF